MHNATSIRIRISAWCPTAAGVLLCGAILLDGARNILLQDAILMLLFAMYSVTLIVSMLQTSIRKKITLGYYAGIFLLIGLSVFTAVELWYVEKKVQFGEVISEFFDTILEIRRFEKNFFLYEKNEDYQENLLYVAKAQRILAENLTGYRRLAVAAQLDKIGEELRIYRGLMEEFPQIGRYEHEQRIRLEKAVREKGKKIITIAEYVSKEERARLMLMINNILKIFIISIGVLSVLGVVVGQILSRMVVKPLKSLEVMMKEISDGKLKTVSIRSRDREIVSLTNAFNRMLKELELRQKHLVQTEKLASLGTLVSGVAHELNNPLSNISSSSQILMEEIDLPEMEYKKELLFQIEEQTDRAKNIVRSLLEFSRNKDFKKEAISLRSLFSETIVFIKGDVPASVEIGVEIPDDIVIFADKQRLQQAFLNLLKNAVDAIEGQGKIMVKAIRQYASSEAREDSSICAYPHYRGKCTGMCPADVDTVDIEISDTGEGIPAEVVSKIFDPFFTTKDVGKGSGLGLFIVQEIIEEHSGCIGVDSEVGKGTTFLIRLPVKE